MGFGFGFDGLVTSVAIIVFFVLSVKVLIIDPGKQSRNLNKRIQ